MAGDWIKMRASLLTSPKVNGIARVLESDLQASKVLSTGFGGVMSEIVTRNVMRNVTVASLLIVWSAANEHTTNGVFKNADLSDIDDMVGIPGFGAAMSSVGWAEFYEDEYSVILPNFSEYNTCGRDRAAEKNAERQKRYREKNKKNNEISNVTNDVTNNDREEKRREENISNTDVLDIGAKTKSTKPDYPDWFEQIWEIYPSRSGSNDKRRALHAAQARIKSGKDPSYLFAAVERYKTFVIASGNFGTQFVMQAATFFGPGEHIDNPWSIDHATSQQRSSVNSSPAKMPHADVVRGQARRAYERINKIDGDGAVYPHG